MTVKTLYQSIDTLLMRWRDDAGQDRSYREIKAELADELEDVLRLPQPPHDALADRLALIRDACIPMRWFSPAMVDDLQEAIQLIRTLAQPVAVGEAFAWRVGWGNGGFMMYRIFTNREDYCDFIDSLVAVKYTVTPLYTHPPAPGRDGFVLVPVEPTREMLIAAGTVEGFDFEDWANADQVHIDWWKAMLAAAPAPRSEP